MLAVGRFLGILLAAFGVWWIVAHIADMPDSRLVVALAALTILVLNHVRWWRLGTKTGDGDIPEGVDHIVVSNYVVMLLVLVLAELRN